LTLLSLPTLFTLPDWARWWMVCIPALALAALLRLGNPVIIPYSGDEAELSLLAMQMTAGEGLPLLGIPSSVGLPNSPMTVYLMAIPYALSKSPVVATAFIAALNVIGVGLLGWLAWRIAGGIPALIATLLYAVNPWAVNYSTKIWAQNFHTPIILLALIFGILGFIDGRRWGQALCLPTLLLGLQMHFAAWALLPIWAAMLWIGRARWSRRAVILSLMLGALTLLPYGIGVLTQPPASLADRGESFSLRALLRPPGFMLWLTTGTGIEQHVARAAAEDFRQQVPQIGLLAVWIGAAAIIGLGMLWRWRQQPISLIVALWALLTLTIGWVGALPGLLGLPWLDVDAHDFIPVIPAMALVSGIGMVVTLAGISRWLQRRWVIAVGVLSLGAIVSLQTAAVLAMQRYVNSHYTPGQFSYATPIHYLLTAAEPLRTYDELVIIRPAGETWQAHFTPAVWQTLLIDSGVKIHQWTPEAPLSKWPPTPFALLLLPGASVPDGLEAGSSLQPIASVPLRPDEGQFDIIQVNSIATSSLYDIPQPEG
jgi:hypothetical protein